MASSKTGRAAVGGDRESLQIQVALSSPSIYMFPLGPIPGGLALKSTDYPTKSCVCLACAGHDWHSLIYQNMPVERQEINSNGKLQ